MISMQDTYKYRSWLQFTLLDTARRSEDPQTRPGLQNRFPPFLSGKFMKKNPLLPPGLRPRLNAAAWLPLKSLSCYPNVWLPPGVVQADRTASSDRR